MQTHIHIIGILLVALALIHIVFPKYFNWKKELAPLNLMNRQMMTIHTLFIAITVFLMGLLCITSANEITTTPLGKKIAFGLSVFWGVRLVIQFFGYSPKLWKGKTFETVMHTIFSCLWVYLTVVFLITAL